MVQKDNAGAGAEETKGPAKNARKKGSANVTVKGLADLLTTSFDGFNYADWLSEFNLTVS